MNPDDWGIYCELLECTIVLNLGSWNSKSHQIESRLTSWEWRRKEAYWEDRNQYQQADWSVALFAVVANVFPHEDLWGCLCEGWIPQCISRVWKPAAQTRSTADALYQELRYTKEHCSSVCGLKLKKTAIQTLPRVTSALAYWLSYSF